MKDKISELTLLLLYLTSWDEKAADTKITGSWKGYPFDTLNELTEKGLIYGSKKAKSVHFTGEGLKMARELKKKYQKGGYK